MTSVGMILSMRLQTKESNRGVSAEWEPSMMLFSILYGEGMAIMTAEEPTQGPAIHSLEHIREGVTMYRQWQ